MRTPDRALPEIPTCATDAPEYSDLAPQPCRRFAGDTTREDQVAAQVADKVAERYEFPALRGVELFLTEGCNLACDYCFAAKRGPKRRMTFDVARKAVDLLLKESRGAENVSITLFGGEPTLAFPLIRQIVEYCEKKSKIWGTKISFDMTTNGTLFSQGMLEYFAEHKVIYLLSVDGNKETHDLHRPMVRGGSSFEKVAQMLPLMKRYQPWMGSRVTPRPDTVPYICENLKYLWRLGINQFIVGPATGIAWSRQQVREYCDQMIALIPFYLEARRKRWYFRMTMFESMEKDEDYTHRWGCRAANTVVAVHVDGKLYGCSKILCMDNLKGPYVVGDVERGFTDPELRRELTDGTAGPRTKCSRCKSSTSCAGGCPATNYEETGNIFLPCKLDCLMVSQFQRVKSAYLEALAKEEPTAAAA